MAATCQVFAQTSEDLKKKQQTIRAEMNSIQQALNETRQVKNAGLSELSLVQKKLQLQEQVVRNLREQMLDVQLQITGSEKDINRLTKELDILKSQYRHSIVYAYQSRSNYDFLNFIFSADSFNDALKRVEYLKSYRNYRKEQAEQIRHTKLLLQQKMDRLQKSREAKNTILQEQQLAFREFEKQRTDKDAVSKRLKSRERELSVELAAKTKTDKELQAGINAAINREMEKLKLAAAREKKDVKTGNAGNTKLSEDSKRKTNETTASILLSDAFETNKGNLDWPVEKGIIKLRFGNNAVPGVIHVVHFNPGLTIETDNNTAVKSVFDGVVTSMFYVEDKPAVIVAHGRYFSAYSNLATAVVKTGDQVKAGQLLGTAAQNNIKKGEIEFVIMEATATSKTNLDPEQWLRKK